MNQEWKDMQTMWEQTNPDGPNADEILRYVVMRAEKFDHWIRWQHRMGWLGAAVGIAGVAKLLSKVESPVEFTFGVSMTAFLVGMTMHIWLRGRFKEPVDRSLSRPIFRATLEKKFASQIHILRMTKYWFALPLIATGGITVCVLLAGTAGWKDLFFFPLILAGTALAWWFNEAVAVKGIHNEWDKIRRALDDGELP